MQNPNDPISKKESSAKARNFLKILKDKRILYWLHLLMDVVKCLSTVALCVQNKDSTLSEVWLELTSAKKILNKYTSNEGPYLRNFIAAEGAPHNVENMRQRLLSRLIQAVDVRFDGDLSLFRDSSFLSIVTWPEDLDDYADAEVQTLAATCAPAMSACVETFNSDVVETEWSRLKTELQNEMKIIKNDWRSRLGDRNISDLLLIDIVSDEVDTFDPSGAIHLWSSTGSQRPYFSETNTPKLREQEVTDEELGADPVVLEAEVEEEGHHDPLLGLLETDHLAFSDEEDDDSVTYDQRDTMELQKKSYKLLLSMMD